MSGYPRNEALRLIEKQHHWRPLGKGSHPFGFHNDCIACHLDASLAREEAERERAERAEAALKEIAEIGSALSDPGEASVYAHHTRSVESCIARDALALSAREPGKES